MTLNGPASMKQLCLMNICVISVVYDFLFELFHFWCKCFNIGTAKMDFLRPASYSRLHKGYALIMEHLSAHCQNS